MVENLDAKQLTCLLKSSREGKVFRTWFKGPGRVVVSDDDRRGPVPDRVGEDLTRMDLVRIEQTDRYDAGFDDLVGAVQGDGDEVFLLLPTDRLQVGESVRRFTDGVAALGDVPPSQFERGLDLARLCLSDARDGLQLLEAVRVEVAVESAEDLGREVENAGSPRSAAEKYREQLDVRQRRSSFSGQLLAGAVCVR